MMKSPFLAIGMLAVMGWRGTEAKGIVAVPLPDSSLYQAESRWQRDDGKTIRLEELRGKVRVVSMFFSGCNSLCPMSLGQLKTLERAMPEALWDKVGFVMVTMDSKDDTPGALKAYRIESGLSPDRWTLLRGSPDDTRELAALLGVHYTPKMEDGQMGHTGLIAILDPEGRMVSHVPAITDQKAFLIGLSRAADAFP